MSEHGLKLARTECAAVHARVRGPCPRLLFRRYYHGLFYSVLLTKGLVTKEELDKYEESAIKAVDEYIEQAKKQQEEEFKEKYPSLYKAFFGSDNP